MKTTKTSAAKTSANKTNTTSANANATKGAKGNKADNKTTKADKDTTPTPAPAPTTPASTANKDGGAVAIFDAATIASTAAAWLETYASIRAIKDNGASLINEVGRDNYKAVLTACKASRAAVIANYHNATAAAWSYSAVLEREYNAVKDSADWRGWCSLISANWPTAAAFVADCYPHTLTNGQPARAVDFTNGTSIYRAFVPLKFADGKDGGAALDILRVALDNLKKVHTKAANSAKDGGALVCTSKHKDGAPVAVYGVKLIDCATKDGGKVWKRATKADKGQPVTAAVSVYSAGKNGARLLTLSEYNADLKDTTSKASK